MTARLFGYELTISLVNTNDPSKLYYIRADWPDGTVGYYRIGQNGKGDIWNPPCYRYSSECYDIKSARRQLKLLKKLFKKEKNMRLSLEAA